MGHRGAQRLCGGWNAYRLSDYDLVLRRAQFDRKGPDSDDFAKRIKDGTIVVNRDLVDYISQTQDSES